MWWLLEVFRLLTVSKPTEIFIVPQIKTLLLGIQEIDDAHMEIINLITETGNKLDNAEFLTFSLKCLDYIYNHFRTEEQYMASINYPGLRIHKLAHTSLYGMMRVYLRPKELKLFTNLEIMEECKKSLIMHIRNHDIQLADFVNNDKLQTVA